MRFQREHSMAFIDSMEKVTNDPKSIKVGEIIKLVAMMKERLDWIVPTSEIIYKFASVAFFDKNESPYSYDPEYCKEKIARWKEAADISDFFIVMQLKDMLPLPTLSEDDLRICLTVIDKMEEHQLNKVLGKNSPSKTKMDPSNVPS